MEWEKSDIHLTKFCGFCLTSLSKHKQKWKKKQNQKTAFSTTPQTRLFIIHIVQSFEWWRDEGQWVFSEGKHPSKQCLNRKTSITGCAVTVENVNPGTALWGVTQTLVIPRRVVKTGRNGVAGKHLHCGAAVTQLRVSSPVLQISVLSCRSHAQEHPKSIQSVSPHQLQAWKFGAHIQELFPSFSEVKLWGKRGSPSTQFPFRMKNSLGYKIIWKFRWVSPNTLC